MWRGEYQPSSISLSDSQRLLPLPSPRNASDFIFKPGPRCLPSRCHSMSSSAQTSTDPVPVLAVMDPPLDRNRLGRERAQLCSGAFGKGLVDPFPNEGRYGFAIEVRHHRVGVAVLAEAGQ